MPVAAWVPLIVVDLLDAALDPETTANWDKDGIGIALGMGFALPATLLTCALLIVHAIRLIGKWLTPNPK